MKAALTTVLLGLVLFATASHNRAGEITYKRIAPFYKVEGGQTVQIYTYSITVTKYTGHGTNIQDRCVDTVYFGDNNKGIAVRINGDSSCGCYHNGKPLGCGEVIISLPNYVVKLNVYSVIHTYQGPGDYTIRSNDAMRNAGVENIPLSDQKYFHLQSRLIIHAFSGPNNSPEFSCKPIHMACVGECFEHSACAFDPDGDSLTYELSEPRNYNGVPIIGYNDPDAGPGGTYGIDERGILRWCVPQKQGEYNMAFIVREWRKDAQGNYREMGYVLRDMQVLVRNCLGNKAPVITAPPDLCVEAGELINETIYFSDPNNGQVVTIEGHGGAFSVAAPPAVISPSSATTFTSVGTYQSQFTWQTGCEHVRRSGYETFLVASDNAPVPLFSYRSFNIRVVPPSIKNVTAVPAGATMRVSWSLSSCNPSLNPVEYYRIYRKDDCSPFEHDPCETGVPESSGFEFVGETDAATSIFIDSNGGKGLVVGQNYSYVVVAVYKDGMTTFGSAAICARLKRDVPVMLNVSVLLTSSSTGAIKIRWALPLTGAENLDTTAFPGPYRFTVNHRHISGGGLTEAYSVTKEYFSPFYQMDMDSCEHSGIDTETGAHEYFVEFIAGAETIGTSQKAGSLFLKTNPADRQIRLNWEAATPWKNLAYKVWRKDPGTTDFNFIATVTDREFLDSAGLVNGSAYCYYIESVGEYSDPGLIKPLYNSSQQVCARPIDKTPPCPPTVTLEAECPSGFVGVSWNDVRSMKCGDDVVEYILYYKPTPDGDYEQVTRGFKTGFIYDGLDLISGCYAVVAVDSSGNKSEYSSDFCIDNCPEFELPNVFTPNNDGVNDHFKAIKVRQIDRIDLRVLDRWGNLVYATTDPYFKWDGTSMITKLGVSDGALVYVCDVYEPRLKGIVKRNLKGTIQVVR